MRLIIVNVTEIEDGAIVGHNQNIIPNLTVEEANNVANKLLNVGVELNNMETKQSK